MNPSGQEFEVTFSKLVYGGEALSRLPDGRAVFVPFALPGETARIRLVFEKRNFARGELVEILSPSPQRINPRCVHFTDCGGCHYQHLSYPDQLTAKEAILKDQLERIGKLTDPAISPAVPAVTPWHYRNHLQFHISEGGGLGFHRPRSETVLEISECHLPGPPLDQIWPQLEIESAPDLDRISLRVGAEEDVLVLLESANPEPPPLHLDLPISAVFTGPEGPQVLAGYEYLVMEVLERTFRVSAESFFQVNTPMAAALVEFLLAQLLLDPEAVVVDAYCGVGLFSAFLAPRVGRLIGIEASPNACHDFVFNLDEFDNVELFEAPVESVLPILDVNPDLVLVDPPRSGLAPAVIDTLQNLAPPTLVYISCDPATLARDARRLVAAGFSPSQFTPFDLFPQTYHIETVSIWHI